MSRWSDRLLAAALLGGALLGGSVATAQELATGVLAEGPIEILTVDQDRLYSGSRFGQKILAEIETELRALQTENRKIESDLEAEEQELTGKRSTLKPEEFRKLADEFDTKVKQIRAARDAKERDIGLQRDLAQKKFFNAAVPILADIMRERGASAILDRKAVLLSFERIDITEIAIARIDAQLASETQTTPPDATAPPPQDQPTEPATAPAPETPPAGADATKDDTGAGGNAP
ncbi:OmpH family outer membrane protein [Tabrizicola sp. J26]|uniref:OmpH family outer membrane protein n=1 Tax=Alitabrizicola rongguiensis TaxID=2909234 RepID=UPI001F19D9D7|nr:OmpH family outer membrane protein [Tabrizicola rongguiensis]MCF1710004.1 OmpH family outer membrane protein [Tabrizicola rongguiensis]